MNKVLLRGGLVRATTRSSGSPFLQLAVRRHSTAEEVAREHADHEDDVAGGRHAVNTNAATTSGSADASPRQVNGSRDYRGNGVAPPAWSSLAAAKPQRGTAADSTNRTEVRPSSWGLSRDDPERAGAAAAVSAPTVTRGALNGSRPPASSRVNGNVAPVAPGNGRQAVVTRNAAPQQNNYNNVNANSRGPAARNPWDIKLSLEPRSSDGAGGNSIARLGHPSEVEAKINGAGGVKSGHLRPFLNGVSSSNSDKKVNVTQWSCVKEAHRPWVSLHCCLYLDGSMLVNGVVDRPKVRTLKGRWILYTCCFLFSNGDVVSRLGFSLSCVAWLM